MTSPPRPLLTVRAALVLLIAIIVGSFAGTLTYLAYSNIASAMLIGGGAAGGALALFHGLLDS